MVYKTSSQVASSLLSLSGGSNASDPISLSLDLPLDGAEWNALFVAIAAVSKYVDLDLSACTGSGSGAGLRVDGTFDPDADVPTGKNYVVSLVLPNATTSIVDGTSKDPTFKGFTALKSLSLPDGIASIGDEVFDGCTSLVQVSLPANLTSIGDWAFADCANLALTSLPSSLTTIGYGAFDGCTNLALTSLPANLKAVSYRAFDGCANLALSSLPTDFATIGHSTFYGCAGIAALDISNVTAIGSYSFDGCTSLVSVTLGTVAPANFNVGNPFLRDLRTVYFESNGGAGTYVRNRSDTIWNKL